MKFITVVAIGLSLSTLAASAAEVVGEATLHKKQWTLTTTDATSGAKVVYQLIGFNKKDAKNHFKGDFLYTKVTGREIACKGGGRCFEVTDFAPEFYDPLKDRLKRK